jgi:hypothetical protein
VAAFPPIARRRDAGYDVWAVTVAGEGHVSSSSRRIFGVGVHRTGTSSVARALSILGFRTSHWSRHEQIMADVQAGNYRLRVMESLDAVLDFPIPVLYRELDAAFPGSRFILTVRDQREWLASAEEHTRSRSLLPEEVMFYGADTFNGDEALNRYREHNQRVIDHFSGRPNLLVLDVSAGEGWERLAPFCDRPVPALPFPWVRPVFEPPGPAANTNRSPSSSGLSGPTSA